MTSILVRTLFSTLMSCRALILENLALCRQFDVLQRNAKRPCLTNRDRAVTLLSSNVFRMSQSSDISLGIGISPRFGESEVHPAIVEIEPLQR